MEIVHIGRRVLCPEIESGEGTIVRADRKRLLFGEEATTYDVVWDNGACTRALSRLELQRPAWVALPEMRSPQACNELWFQHLLAQARARRGQPTSASARPLPAAAPAAARGATPPAASKAARESEGAAAGGAPQPPGPMSRAAASRAITQAARQALADRGFERVAVTTQQRVAGSVLNVAWMDGPAAGAMYAALRALKEGGAVARIDLARSASTLMLQAAIAYIHEQFYRPQELEAPEPRLARVLLQVTPEAYQHHALSAVSAPMGHAHSGLSYQQLVRCVFERWDDQRGRFCDTASCRHMVAEKAALFPAGDAEASMRMRLVRDRLQLAQHQLEELLADPSEGTREQPR